VVVDLGSAVTVDLVSPSGAFSGGAILPGIAMSARALHAQTDLLPDIAMSDLREPPPALGASTEEAIRAGLYWGAVGAARELIARLTAGADHPPLVLLTGGAAPAVAKLLDADARYLPHLVLSGIAAAAESP
jgi:type III pantothenate kinase